MVCPVAEAAQRVKQLLNGIVVVKGLRSNRKCYYHHSTDFFVFDALLAIAASQESFDCPTVWQNRGACLYCHGVEIQVVVAKSKVVCKSLTVAVRHAALAELAHAAALLDLLLHYASKQRSRSTLSIVIRLLCRVSCDVRESIAKSLTSRDLDSLISHWKVCYDELALFVATFDMLILTDDQWIVFFKETLKRQPNSYSLRAAAELLTYNDLDMSYLSDAALWAVSAPQNAASEAVDVFFALHKHGFLLQTSQLGQFATIRPQSSKLFDIYCIAALRGDFGGLDYLESAAQLDNAFIDQHANLLIKLDTNAIEASLRVCNRPGYRSLWRHILCKACKYWGSGISRYDRDLMQVFKPYRPQLDILLQEFVDEVVVKCKYSSEDLEILSKINTGKLPPLGDSTVCRADLLKTLYGCNRGTAIDVIHTSCEMALVMQRNLAFDLQRCTLYHSYRQRDYCDMATCILNESKNIQEVIAVLDAHKDPYEGLKYTNMLLKEAAVYLFESNLHYRDKERLECISNALGQVDVSELLDSVPPRWKEVAVACMLGLKYGTERVMPVESQSEQLSSPVIEYALSLGGSLSKVRRSVKSLGALAPIALCATDMFSGKVDDALFIARDPRALKIAKYHTEVFGQIALCIAGYAVRLAKDKVPLCELAWVFEYLPAK